MEEEVEMGVLAQNGRTSGDSNSPEFEFWMIRNPSCPQPNLLSADELFADGFVIPLHLIDDRPPSLLAGDIDEFRSDEAETSTAGAADLSATSSLTSSKRWIDVFKKSDKKVSRRTEKLVNSGEKEIGNAISKEKKREKKNGTVVAGTAELNINIWPFSRSRSAGTGGTRPRSVVATRKVSSAPCSRSNSAGEYKSRKWPSSPGRTGIHVGKSFPVWQVPRGGSGRRPNTFINNVQKGSKKEGNQCRRRSPAGGNTKSKVLTLNIPMCIGYRQHISCSNDENNAAAGDVGDISGNGVRVNNLFNIRNLFSKKVY